MCGHLKSTVRATTASDAVYQEQIVENLSELIRYTSEICRAKILNQKRSAV